MCQPALMIALLAAVFLAAVLELSSASPEPGEEGWIRAGRSANSEFVLESYLQRPRRVLCRAGEYPAEVHVRDVRRREGVLHTVERVVGFEADGEAVPPRHPERLVNAEIDRGLAVAEERVAADHEVAFAELRRAELVARQDLGRRRRAAGDETEDR